MITPLEKYQQDLKREDFQKDSAQEDAVERLDDLFHRLIKRHKQSSSLFARITSIFSDRKPEQGLYFWGGVGRGKTYLVDTFYDCLPFKQKKRLHFRHNVRGTVSLATFLHPHILSSTKEFSLNLNFARRRLESQ